MNRQGIFCFLLLLAFFALEARFFALAGEARHGIAEASSLAFEAEKAAFIRALMESSVDSAIEESLRQGLAMNLGPEEIKWHVNNRLASLFKEMEKAYREEMPVRFDSESLKEGFLNENSSVIVTRIGEKEVEALYCFTGGLMKSNRVLAEIEGKRAKVFFIVPAGYCAKATLLGRMV